MPRVIETHASTRRARVAVHGLDRDPDLGRQLVDRLGRRPGVLRVSPSPLTGRVLVELAEGAGTIEEIVDVIAELEVPVRDSGRDVPAHPLDPVPVIEGAAKTLGAALGLLLLLTRRAVGAEGAPVSGSGPGEVAGAIGLVEAVPAVAGRIEDTLGHQRKELLFGASAIVAMSASGNPLGLAFAGAAALRLLTESLARRRAWRAYEERLGEHPTVYAGAVLELSRGQRTPMQAQVLEGSGVGSALDGAPQALYPRATMDPGARVYSGNVTVELSSEPHLGAPRPQVEASSRLLDRYLRSVTFGSLLYALATGIATRSPGRILTALLLVNPVPALAGRDTADRGASARVLRAGVTVVGSRPGRAIRLPHVVLIDEPRPLCEGWEVTAARAFSESYDTEGVLALASAVSASAGSPWGLTFTTGKVPRGVCGTFDGRVVGAEVDGDRWLLEPAGTDLPVDYGTEPDEYVVVLRRQRDGLLAGAFGLRPRLTRGVASLVQTCQALNVRLELTTRSATPHVRRIAERAGIALVAQRVEDRVIELRKAGQRVAVVGDSIRAAAAFDRCDLAVGLSSGQSGTFAARADLLAPELEAAAAIVQTGAGRDAAVRDGVLVSAAANLGGAGWGALGGPPFRLGNRPAHVGGLIAIADGVIRLWGGRRTPTEAARLNDPFPERWGRESVASVLRQLNTSDEGLTSKEARARWRARPPLRQTRGLVDQMLDQIKSPLVAVLGAGAALSMAMGAVGDVVMIASVIAANAVVGAWQEGRADAATKALHELSASTARVLRDRRQFTLAHADLVPGDVVLVASGDRVPADARIISTELLEVDEAALTGESIPVVKSAVADDESGRILLEGTDVLTGTGRAVVVAVGADTRMGSIAAALAEDSDHKSPLDERLGEMLVHGLPWIAAGGLVVTTAGVLWGRSPLSQLALGASVAIAAVPEGLPLLAGVAEAAVAQRLASRQALVTRLSAVEALGRVDVACVDKTGTLTTGTLELTLVADAWKTEAAPNKLTPELERVLQTAAIASPSPDALDADAHPTDVAVLTGARLAGLRQDSSEREAESRFDPARSFHATAAGGRLYAKGAAEMLAMRCTYIRGPDGDAPLDGDGRTRLPGRASELAAQGLRILLVAQGGNERSVEDPIDLTALGFVGISDPLRPGAASAVQRCREAGVRVVMLTGDHPATATAIARDAGLSADVERLLTGDEVAALDDETLSKRLARATIIARSTPLQKLRIVELLRGAGHVVAMTGDGVNDAPALRLADVGVAMGSAGTDVARQAADLVLIDDEFATLAEALVEGRGFWHNMRRALGLLLGGNAGEVALMVAAAVSGRAPPLNTRQILTVNLVTDVLPAVSVAIQPPEHRNLAELSREGGAALDGPLRADITRRGIATGTPSFAAYMLTSRVAGPAAGQCVAYISLVTTQLAQTVDLGQAEGGLTGSVLGAVAGSLAVVAATVTVPGARSFLALTPPTGAGLLIAGGASALAVALGRALPFGRGTGIRAS
jgi:calcium-translocating P-type ATPase